MGRKHNFRKHFTPSIHRAFETPTAHTHRNEAIANRRQTFFQLFLFYIFHITSTSKKIEKLKTKIAKNVIASNSLELTTGNKTAYLPAGGLQTARQHALYCYNIGMEGILGQ